MTRARVEVWRLDTWLTIRGGIPTPDTGRDHSGQTSRRYGQTHETGYLLFRRHVRFCATPCTLSDASTPTTIWREISA